MKPLYYLLITSFAGLSLTSALQRKSQNELTPSCSSSSESCTFDFVVSHVYSMVWYDPVRLRRARPVIIYPNGTAVFRERPTCQTVVPMTEEQLDSVITADGTIKMLMVVNNQLPGPPIVVYEGQEVVVNVTNGLVNEACTIHWHGLVQRGTPWMDGGGEVSQCAIQPGETFTYRFRAEPVGTHWYHAHVGTQRTEGLYGPIVVLRNPTKDGFSHGLDGVPRMEKEFSMMFQDWYHETSFNIFVQFKADLTYFGSPLEDTASNKCYEGTHNVDGFQNGFLRFESALINGKGRQYPENSTVAMNLGIPIEIFHVKKGSNYLFRATGTSMAHSFLLTVDGHKLHVVASDSVDIVPTVVDMLIIAAGERYDFYIETSDPDRTGNYWIRLETLEHSMSAKTLTTPGHVEAVLRYEGGVARDPVSSRRKCTPSSPCVVLNCPYRYYPVAKGMECLSLTDLKQRKPERTLTHDVEHFLHFRYANGLRAVINGRVFLPPVAPPQTYPDQKYLKESCEIPECAPGNDFCACTHILEVPLFKVIQFVFFIQASTLQPSSHPIHMHGHQYQVVKIGYPEYDQKTGSFISSNKDIECLDEYCNSARWANASWREGNIPGVTGIHPVRKDTVSVPVGGYVVVRFYADNPGFWFLHCHMEFHMADGMALVVKEGTEKDMKPLPPRFKTCGAFSWTEEEYRNMFRKQLRGLIENHVADSHESSMTKAESPGGVDHVKSGSANTVTTVLIVLSAGLFVLCIALAIRLKKAGDRIKYTPLN